MMKIISVVGARPNFMKIAPFIHAIKAHNAASGSEKIEHLLVHTGQHYDDRMSKAFFEALNIPEADINLEVGSAQEAGSGTKFTLLNLPYYHASKIHDYVSYLRN